LEIEPDGSGAQPHGAEMMRLRERRAQQYWRRILLVVAAIVALLAPMRQVATQESPTRQKRASIVEIQRYKFYDACFYGVVDAAVETTTDIRVSLKIKHKQSAGRCGCRSANLQVLVFVQGNVNGPPDPSLSGKRLVATTPRFLDTLEAYALTIKKLSSEPPQHYKLWLSCAD
jgi:hypothetical protein